MISARPLKVLIADDDPTTRHMLRAVLGRWGYETCEACCGEEALVHFQGENAAELALFDWVMPGLSGPELCRLLRQHRSEQITYVILLTSKGDRSDVIEGLDSGADDFVVKPYDNGELRARLAVGERMVRLRQELREVNRGLEERVRQRTQEVHRLLEFNRDLLHRLSHDLKTPLTPLVALLPLLHRDETVPERKDMLAEALEGARNIQFTVHGVLELCRAAGSEPAIPPEGEQLHRISEMAMDECRRRRQVQQRQFTSLVPGNLRVLAEARMTRRLLGLLLDNTVQFTGASGQITVSAEPRGNDVVVSVQDDGVGIASDQLPRVFEPFYKADVSRHQLRAPGLGLALARALVERQGGRIWAESGGPGKGAVFRFTLPQAPRGGDRVGEALEENQTKHKV